MRGEWCYFPGYFSAETCELILQGSDHIDWSTGLIGVDNEINDQTTRRSDIKFLQSTDETFANLFREIWHLGSMANRDWFDVHITKLDYVQLARYDSDVLAEYGSHQDVFWINNDARYHRKLTCLVQLSDPASYQGGDLELIDTASRPPADAIRQQGTVIVFPSFFYHRALPVTAGTRYSLAAWFDGPKWR